MPNPTWTATIVVTLAATSPGRRWKRAGRTKHRDALNHIYSVGRFARFEWPLGEGYSLDCNGDETTLIEKQGEYAKVQMEYLKECVVEASWYSVSRPESQPDFYFQVLRYATRAVKKPFTTKKKSASRTFHLTSQGFEVWRSDKSRGVVTVFPHGDPEIIDSFTITKFRKVEYSLQCWTSVSPSDTEGCWDLACPRRAVPLQALEDPSCPIWCLNRALLDKGWKPVPERVCHSVAAGAERVYSVNKIYSGRYYFRCVLSIESLLAAGVETFVSNEVVHYYQCLLKGIVVPTGLGSKAYKALVAGTSLDIVLALTSAPQATIADKPSDQVGGENDDEVLQASCTAPLPLPLAPPSTRVTSSSSSSSRESSSCEDDVMHAGAVTEDAPIDVPAFLEGGAIDVEDASARHGYKRYVIACPWHRGCKRRRNDHAQQRSHFGRHEPIAFLAVWCMSGREVATAAEHNARNFPAPLAAQRDWLERRGYL